MKFALRRRDELVGAFVLAGILFLAAALLFLGFNKRWFQRDPEYRSHFNTAEGLSAGLALEFQGFAVGRVKRVRLADDRRVEAVLSVHREHADLVRPGSVVELVVQPLGFGAKLLLYPGRGAGEPLPAGSLILSTDQPEGRDRVASGAVARPQRRDEIGLLLAALPGLAAELQTLAVTTRRLVARLDRQLLGDQDAGGDGLLAVAGGLLRTADATTASAGELTRRLETVAAELDGLLGQVRRASGTQGLLPALVGEQGSAARLFRDDGALYDELIASLAEVREILAFFDQSTPDLAVLVREATAALAAGEKVAQGLRNNPLLRGGIEPDPPGPDTFHGYRDEVP